MVGSKRHSVQSNCPTFTQRFVLPLVLAAALTVPTKASAVERYICASDLSTGFRWNGQRWVTATFRVNNERFLVEEMRNGGRSSEGNQFTHVVRKSGSNDIEYSCTRSEHEGAPSDYIVCGGMYMGMLINVKSLRFQTVYGGGFLDGRDKPGDAPSFTLGRCTQIK